MRLLLYKADSLATRPGRALSVIIVIITQPPPTTHHPATTHLFISVSENPLTRAGLGWAGKYNLGLKKAFRQRVRNLHTCRKVLQNLLRARNELEVLEITHRHPEHEGKRENNCLKEVKEESSSKNKIS